ncbi:MAG: hypothetical protein ABSF95_14015 [Verrucomicrobiota bacterium]|jgi:hypothetical protein
MNAVSTYERKDFTSSPAQAPQQWAEGLSQHWITENAPDRPALRDSVGFAEALKRIIPDRSSHLTPQLRQRIKELSDLKENWDGEGAAAVKAHILADVIEVLKRLAHRAPGFREPFLAPTFGGFVQIEWHDPRRSLEIEAVGEGWAVVGAMNSAQGQRLYFASECSRGDFKQLERFYDWFLGRDELIWPSP